MASAKDILVKPINARAANALVKKVHYSGKVVPNSNLHFGVFLSDKLEGVMSFGSPMVKKLAHGLVEGTTWNGMLELNRMAFSDALPKNSESRAMGVAFRLIKKHYPHIEWILSYSDGTQCGDGTIYRASGFWLTGIKENKSIIAFPDGSRYAFMTLKAHWDSEAVKELCDRLGVTVKPRSTSEWQKVGGKALSGYQLRYIKPLKEDVKDRLLVPILPFSKIDEVGAGMYKGEKVSLQDRRVKELT